jgi:pimeloyl-ACP methyl ester carboxylesterase
LAAGVRRLHQSPLEGESVSANHPDVPQHVRFTEAMLFTLLQESAGTFMISAGEVPAAMVALGHGDLAPALRLAADATDMFNVLPSDVPASVNSGGGYSAIECSDYRLPWRPGVALDDRIDAAANSVRRLDVQHRIGAWTANTIVRTPEYGDWEQLINCNRWPDVNAEPVVPDDSHYPRVPTLVMTSDLDPGVPLENAQRQAARWPRSQLLDIGGALHGAALWACGPDRVRAFLRLPGSIQAPCDRAELPAFRAVGEFPVTAAEARPLDVDASATDSSTIADRRLAAVALETALDANSVSGQQFFLGTGTGLRGGQAVSSVENDQFRIDLIDDRFAADVAVNGTMIFPFDGSTPTIDITFITDDGSSGHLSVAANWTQGRSAAEPNVVPVTGQVDGRAIALLLPL